MRRNLLMQNRKRETVRRKGSWKDQARAISRLQEPLGKRGKGNEKSR